MPSENRDLDYYRQAFTEVVNVLMPNRTDEETSRANGHIDAAAELKSSISQVSPAVCLLVQLASEQTELTQFRCRSMVSQLDKQRNKRVSLKRLT